MRRFSIGLSSLLIIVLVSVGIAFAQDDLTIEVGDIVTASTDGASVTYLIDLEIDQTIEIALASDEFDAFVEVQNADGETLGEDDDGGEDFDSLLMFTAPIDGTYSIIVRSFLGTPNGEYTLSITGSAADEATDETVETDDAEPEATEAPDADSDTESADEADADAAPDTTEVEATSIEVGASVAGEADDNNTLYTLVLNVNQMVVFDLSSEDFDTFIEVQSEAGNTLATDDDGGEGTNSLLEFSAPETGVYTVIVRSFTGTPTGAYTLSVLGEGDEAPTEAESDALPEPVVFSEVAEGNVTYEIELAEGETIRLTLVSEEFDPYLQVNNEVGDSLATDDDSAGDRNAFIEFTAPSDGTYTLLVRAFAGEANGQFELTIEAVAPPADETSEDAETSDLTGDNLQVVIFEETAEGNVTFEVELSENETILIRLDSDEFDPFIEVLDSTGNSLAEDDDGGDELNSLLEFTAPAEGTYTILVRSFVNEAEGDFLLSIETLRLPDDSTDATDTSESTSDATEDTEATETPAEDDAETSDVPVERGEPSVISDTAAENVAYELELTAGETLEIALSSEDFDPFIEVQDAAGNSLAEDDDSGPSLNSLLVFTAPEDGVYTLIVRSFGSIAADGAFDLVLTPLGAPAPAETEETTEASDSDVLDITNAPVTINITEMPQATILFTVEAGTKYFVKLEATEPLDGNLAVSIMKDGGLVAALNATNTDEFSLSYAADEAGTADLFIAYEVGDVEPIEITISLEVIE